ncbi:DUF3397 family protein [Streptococcus iniae]|uniref:DUF3397 family protein n=1 Tax=Streptococcus iniae TaxID=1346 RepID=UPI0008DA1F6F|nr:DUF3397 family protein [Streptococcus iniae]OHX26569.1 hypothetical protein BKX95_09680 [Streptococcus iniae]RLV27449.1 DUF3397 family protein [Streptococcus iniae]
MITYKLIALAFIILTPLFSHIMVSFFRLGRYGLKFPDLALVFFGLELFLVSGKFLSHSLLPHYLIMMSLLALIITLILVFKSQQFTYHRFIKLFWRIGFLITSLSYILLACYVFIV